MAVYKVPQDVEAEDKLLGPLTFKQFIFMLIAVGSIMFGWLLFGIHPALSLLAAPFIVIFGGLAIFRREDQPVERYLLSFFNYLLRPRTRVWSTEGYYEHLIITAPKRKAEPQLKQDIGEVHGQLEKLAQIVDTRGWASKRPDLQLPGAATMITNDDRLFVPDAPVSQDGVEESEDIMDSSNPEVAKLDKLISERAEQEKQKVIRQMSEQPRKPAAKRQDDDQTDQTVTDEKKTGKKSAPKPHNKSPSGGAEEAGDQTSMQQPQPPNPDILELSSELKVSQMAAAANRQNQNDQQLQKGEEIKLR